jgi:hypothetical protein
MTDRPPPGFVHGVFAGFAGFVVLVQAALVVAFPDMRALYRDMGADIRLPLLTRITIHPAWTWGTPLVGAAAVTWLLIARPRSLSVYGVVAVALAAVALLTYWYPRAPIYELAGNIRAE